MKTSHHNFFGLQYADKVNSLDIYLIVNKLLGGRFTLGHLLEKLPM